MKYLRYILRNAMRNPVRSLLTIGSTAVCLFLMMILLAFLAVQTEATQSLRPYNRIVVMSSQGFAQPLPIAMVNDLRGMKSAGVIDATPFSWYGGKLGEEEMPFAQFGVDPATFFAVYDELVIPEEQKQAWRDNLAGCIIGKKMADERGFKIGDKIQLKGTIYEFALDLTVSGIYDGPENSDKRSLYYNWNYLEEGLKKNFAGRAAGNAGVVIVKCDDSSRMATLSKTVDDQMINTPTPTRTQTEEAFGNQFLEMWGDVRGLIRNVGLAVIFSLVCVAANAMAMSMRERVTEVAVLKAIGFSRRLVMFFVIAEAMIVAGIGGVVGAMGSKLLFHYFDISQFAAGFLASFYIPWSIALSGMAIALFIGFLSGILPARQAARLSVINGLRKVV